MTTAYNLHNKMARGKNAARTHRLDPSAGGVIVVSPVDNAIVELDAAGTYTLEAAAGVGLGTSIICLSSIAGVIIAGPPSSITIGDGEWVELVIVKDSSGDHEWQERSGTAAITTAQASTAANTAALAVVQAGTTTGTGDISAYDETTFKAVLQALDLAGILTDATTT